MEKLLKKLGFSQNEAKIYLAALETGLASAQDIAKKASLERTTAYSVLGALAEKGLVARSKNKNKSRFLAEPPDKLLDRLSGLRVELETVLPELAAKYNDSGTKPKILFYEGPNALQEVYDDTLKTKPAEILEWNTDAYFKHEGVDHGYIKKRVRHGIKARRIASKGSEWDLVHLNRDPFELAETLIVPKEEFSPGIEIDIYGDKVAFLNYEERMSIIIESKAITNAMRQIYELSWKGGKSG